MTFPQTSNSAALSEAEKLTLAGHPEAAAEILEGIVQREPDLHAMLILASIYLQVGRYDDALRHAAYAAHAESSSAPAKGLLAKINLARGDYVSALSDYEAIVALCREQRPAPPEQCSIPAHFALRNLEQLDYILAQNRGEHAPAESKVDRLHDVRRTLAETIDGADREAPWISVNASSSRILVDPPYVKVAEEKLPCYLNADVNYEPLRQAISAGTFQADVIDGLLTPAALQQVQKFCLESTVWRHPYKFGYVGAFPEDGFVSASLFAIAEEFCSALGDVFDGYHLAQWWAFEYDARLPGTDIHGDDADFSLNFWITPDSANLDPASGGLVVWDATAPSDWSFDDYNSGGDRVKQFLADRNAVPRVIPYRENRAVLFRGRLFHRTDDFTFAPGFVNRRRSITLLFRRRA